MIPVESVEDCGLRAAISSMETVREIMNHTPQDLPEHYRSRKTHLENALKQRQPHEMIRMLRDLCWLEHISGLNHTDIELKRKLRQSVAVEISTNPALTEQSVWRELQAIIRTAIQKHAEDA